MVATSAAVAREINLGERTSVKNVTRSVAVLRMRCAGEPCNVVDAMPSGWKTASLRYASNVMPAAYAIACAASSMPVLE